MLYNQQLPVGPNKGRCNAPDYSTEFGALDSGARQVMLSVGTTQHGLNHSMTYHGEFEASTRIAGQPISGGVSGQHPTVPSSHSCSNYYSKSNTSHAPYNELVPGLSFSPNGALLTAPESRVPQYTHLPPLNPPDLSLPLPPFVNHDPVGFCPGNPPPSVQPAAAPPAKRRRNNKGKPVTDPNQPLATGQQKGGVPPALLDRAKKTRQQKVAPVFVGVSQPQQQVPSVPQKRTRQKKDASVSVSASQPQKQAQSVPRIELNRPAADGRHHPSPAVLPATSVNHLEVAALDNTHVVPFLFEDVQSTPLPADCPKSSTAIPPAPPLEDLAGPVPKKISNDYVLAKKTVFHPFLLHSRTPSSSKRASAEQRKIMAIKAIERGVSVAMVDKYLGQCRAMRKLSTWQMFLKTEQHVRGFVVVSGKGGVAQTHPMGEIGQIYHACGKKLPALGGEVSGDGDVIDGLTATERALDDTQEDGDHSVQNEKRSFPAAGPPAMRRTVSMAGASAKVQDFLDEWVIKANRVAETYKCDMILFTASRYLGANSYQLTTTTNRAYPFLQLADDLDGQNTYGTRFHGWLVGQSSEAIAAQADPENPIRPRPMDIKARLARLIAKKTENIWTKWPWTDCEKVLAKHGFRLVLHPKIRTERYLLNRPGKHLLAPQISALHLDLDNKYIDVVRVPRSSSSRSPSITPSDHSRSSSTSLSYKTSLSSSTCFRSGSTCQISPRDESEESEWAGISGAASRDVPESVSSSSSSQKSSSSGRPPTPSALGNLESEDFSDDSSRDLPSL
ncbi:hypothetical protein H4Q26_011008 [Puccinia striiformis f. sp. tritici PST-130]|nr:hypothetical protein H4Q26_011008 [Puccinia striiformis f. sp. tritici PST-130]